PDADRSVHRAGARRELEPGGLWPVNGSRMEQAAREASRPSPQAVQRLTAHMRAINALKRGSSRGARGLAAGDRQRVEIAEDVEDDRPVWPADCWHRFPERACRRRSPSPSPRAGGAARRASVESTTIAG